MFLLPFLNVVVSVLVPRRKRSIAPADGRVIQASFSGKEAIHIPRSIATQNTVKHNLCRCGKGEVVEGSWGEEVEWSEQKVQ